ncbi:MULTISPECIES: hypothetical protein [unclassified Streptomyces]|uniref:hypothetical protein n=1 Tax=unclassified Streptomyces TaxID=2593676 RepID=UPI0034272E83
MTKNTSANTPAPTVQKDEAGQRVQQPREAELLARLAAVKQARASSELTPEVAATADPAGKSMASEERPKTDGVPRQEAEPKRKKIPSQKDLETLL